jgi:shikimate dehydrogenase
VLLLGAGGAARAIAFAMAAEGPAGLGIWNRTGERAARLVAEVKAAFPALEVAVSPADGRGFDLVVNCTSLGMHAGDPLPMDPASLAAEWGFIDIIAVRDTELMQAARARGCRVVGGRPMAELQIEAQLRFFGLR